MMVCIQQVAVGIFLFLQVFSIEAKLQTGSVVLSGTDPELKWEYVSKFGYGVGAGDYSMRVRLHDGQKKTKHARLSLEVFLDEDWDSVQSLPRCQRAQEGPARAVKPLMLPGNGKWGKLTTGNVYQSIRPHIWYFAFSNCDAKFAHLLNGTVVIDYEIRAQDGGSEFSVEMQYMFPMSVGALLIFSVFLLHFAMRCHVFRRSVGSIHLVVGILAAAILLQFAGQVFEVVHLCRFKDDGVGVESFDVLAQILLMMSQVVQTTLLISIALGYTLLHATVDEVGLVKPAALAISVIHAALVAIGKFHGNSAFKYHENEGVVGWALLTLRCGMYMWFVMAVNKSQQKGGFRLQAFLLQFRTAGSIYFLAYPVLFVIVQVFAPYLQHPIMQTGLLTMQTASHFWLASLFLSRGDYFKASVLGSSALPGGSSFCLPSKES